MHYLNKMAKEQFYPQVYGDGNYAIYASLLAIKQLPYTVIKYEKQKKYSSYCLYYQKIQCIIFF